MGLHEEAGGWQVHCRKLLLIQYRKQLIQETAAEAGRLCNLEWSQVVGRY